MPDIESDAGLLIIEPAVFFLWCAFAGLAIAVPLIEPLELIDDVAAGLDEDAALVVASAASAVPAIAPDSRMAGKRIVKICMIILPRAPQLAR